MEGRLFTDSVLIGGGHLGLGIYVVSVAEGEKDNVFSGTGKLEGGGRGRFLVVTRSRVW